MSRRFQDSDFLVWEAYPSGSKFGYAERPHIIFNCLTNRRLRPRFVESEGDAADAERLVATARPADLLELLGSAREIA